MPRSNVLMVACAAAAALQAPPPATDVFLAAFSSRDGKVTVGKPTNISNGPGYDNQPSFTPDGQAVLFTSVRGERKPDPANSAQTGSDIYRYDIAAARLTQVTATPGESEYSPTVMPDGKHFSVVRVEPDGTQRLWKFALDGTNPELVLKEVRPVGYHAWADSTTAVLFVLGEPATLQVADLASGKATPVAKDIGRSLQRMADGGISFVQRDTKEQTVAITVMRLDPKTRQTTALVSVMPDVRDPGLAWTPDGLLLLAHAGKLYGWRRGDPALAVVADLDALGLHGVTRLAVSPKGDQLALVAQQ